MAELIPNDKRSRERFVAALKGLSDPHPLKNGAKVFSQEARQFENLLAAVRKQPAPFQRSNTTVSPDADFLGKLFTAFRAANSGGGGGGGGTGDGPQLVVIEQHGRDITWSFDGEPEGTVQLQFSANFQNSGSTGQLGGKAFTLDEWIAAGRQFTATVPEDEYYGVTPEPRFLKNLSVTCSATRQPGLPAIGNFQRVVVGQYMTPLPEYNPPAPPTMAISNVTDTEATVTVTGIDPLYTSAQVLVGTAAEQAANPPLIHNVVTVHEGVPTVVNRIIAGNEYYGTPDQTADRIQLVVSNGDNYYVLYKPAVALAAATGGGGGTGGGTGGGGTGGGGTGGGDGGGGDTGGGDSTGSNITFQFVSPEE